MRRSAFFTALLCATIVPAFAASSAPAPKPPVPLLWKVSDSDNSVYLLGSFHMLRADDYPLSPDVDAALADAEAVMFELPPEEMGSKELAAKLMTAAVRTDGTMLDSDLTPNCAPSSLRGRRRTKPRCARSTSRRKCCRRWSRGSSVCC